MLNDSPRSTYEDKPHRSPPPSGDLADQSRVDAAKLIDLMMHVTTAIRASLAPGFSQFHLNDARFAVLRAIEQYGNAGCSQSELAEQLQQSESNASTLLERMQRDGLVVRRQSQKDRRKSMIRLSPQGRQLFRQVQVFRARRADELFCGVSSQVQSEIYGQLQRVLEHFHGQEHNGQTMAVAVPSEY